MRSIVAQVSLSLAAAELAFEMEHRDLHFGNILVRKLHDPQAKLRYRVGGRNYSVVTEGYVAAIIDFTLSRVTGESEFYSFIIVFCCVPLNIVVLRAYRWSCDLR